VGGVAVGMPRASIAPTGSCVGSQRLVTNTWIPPAGRHKHVLATCLLAIQDIVRRVPPVCPLSSATCTPGGGSLLIHTTYSCPLRIHWQHALSLGNPGCAYMGLLLVMVATNSEWVVWLLPRHVSQQAANGAVRHPHQRVGARACQPAGMHELVLVTCLLVTHWSRGSHQCAITYWQLRNWWPVPPTATYNHCIPLGSVEPHRKARVCANPCCGVFLVLFRPLGGGAMAMPQASKASTGLCAHMALACWHVTDLLQPLLICSCLAVR
jgi:hypothetical protein